MAGIFGFIKNSDRYNQKDLSATFLKNASLGFNHPNNFTLSKDGNAGIGYCAPYISSLWPLTSKDGRFIFQCFGGIYLPDDSPLSEKNFEDAFLPQFLEDKNAFLRQLDGGFIFVLYDSLKRSITLCNDLFGNFSIHYYQDKEIFLFSNQVHSITEILNKKEWDPDGFNQFLGLGFSLNGNTYYKNIKRLQPCHTLTYENGQAHLSKYYSPNFENTKFHKSSIENITSSFISSFKKILLNNKNVGAAITGGFDSRVSWGIINHLQYQQSVTAFTHGLKNSRDISIAQKISSRFKLDHKIMDFDNTLIQSLTSLWEPFVKATAGYGLVTSAHALKSWEFGKKYYSVLLDSHGGALYRRQYMKALGRKVKFSDNISESIFQIIKSPLLSLNILKGEIRDDIIKSSVVGLDKYFETLRTIKNTEDKIDLFYIHQISGNRYSEVGNAQMDYLKLSHPFLNRDGFFHVQEVPVKYRKNQLIYRHTINSIAPEMKSFYLENMGMPAPYSGFTYLRYIPMIYEMLLAKSLGKASVNLYKKLSFKRLASDHDLFFRINIKAIKEILLRNNNSFFTIIDRKELEQLISIGERNENYRLSSWSQLITLKLFFDIFH